MDTALYNARILRLAASIPHRGRLDAPMASAQRTSPICGSRVTVDVAVDGDGRVAAFAQEVRACALGQASAAILGGAVIGTDASLLAESAAALKVWLRGADEGLPPVLAARWPELGLFAPARAFPARHASIALPFEAAAAAAADATARRAETV